MKDLIFWNNWPKELKNLYWAALFFVGSAIIFFSYYYFAGISSVMEWTVGDDIQNVEVTIDNIRLKLFDLPVQSENYVIYQIFHPTLIVDNYLSSRIFLVFLAFAATLMITVISCYQKITWYAVSSFIFVLWLSFLKLDVLGFFGQYNNTLLAIMLLAYLGTSYYFHSWKEEFSFFKRFLIFSGITAVLGMLIFLYSDVAHPEVHLASFGSIGGGITLILFICVIGYEILQLTISVLTMTKNDKPWFTPLNFFIITVLYTGNLIVYYLYITGEIEWNIPYNVYLFFPICAILGIWSHRKRGVLYLNFFKENSHAGAFLYITMAIISMATLAYITSIQLTPALKIFEIIFIVTQASFGIAFFAYIIRNFYKSMMDNDAISKVIYSDKLMPHSYLRALGLIIILFFVGKNSSKFLNELHASHYTLKGNWYRISGDKKVAEQNYRDALKYYPGGHQASFGLASIFIEQGKMDSVIFRLKDVNYEEESEHIYTSIANIYAIRDEKINQLLVLQDAQKKFPKSHYIANNLGIVFNQMGIVDSAIFYLKKSIELKETSASNANLIAVAVKTSIKPETKILELDARYTNDAAYMGNAYAYANMYKLGVDKDFDLNTLTDGENGYSLSLANNYVDQHLNNVPKEFIEKLKKWSKDYEYSSYSDNINFILAKTLFYNGEVKAGLNLMNKLTRTAVTTQRPFYANIAALMYTKIGLYDEAYDLLQEADQTLQLSSQNSFVRENTAILALQTGEFEYASLLLPVLSTYIPEKKEQYDAIYQIINGTNVKGGYAKAFELLFLNKSNEDINYKAILDTFPKSKLKDVLVLSLIEKSLDENDRANVEYLWKTVPSEFTDKYLFEKSNLLSLRTSQMFGDTKGLEQKLASIELDPFDNRWKTYLNALIYQSKKDTANASKYFDEALLKFPNHEGVTTSYVYYQVEKGNKMKAYEICAEYLRTYTRTKLMLVTFVDLALMNNLFVFADEAVKDLTYIMKPAEYEEFFKNYQKRIASFEF